MAPKCPGGPRPAVCASGAAIRHLLGALAEDVGLALGQYPARKGSVSASFFSGGQLAAAPARARRANAIAERWIASAGRESLARCRHCLAARSQARPLPHQSRQASQPSGVAGRRRASSGEAGGTTGSTAGRADPVQRPPSSAAPVTHRSRPLPAPTSDGGSANHLSQAGTAALPWYAARPRRGLIASSSARCLNGFFDACTR